MGKFYRGIPEKYAFGLIKKYSLTRFIETGTLTGNTSAWASKLFLQVDTIEVHEDWYDRASKRLADLNNVKIHLGDSRTVLWELLKDIDVPCFIWLDAHWSRDLGYDRPIMGECPILEEIDAIIRSGIPHVVLIDDARYFINPPPADHKSQQWPNFNRIKEAFGENWEVKHNINNDTILATIRGR